MAKTIRHSLPQPQLACPSTWPTHLEALEARRAPQSVSLEQAQLSVEHDGEPVKMPEEIVRCRTCGSMLARKAHAINVDGQNEHCFLNPQGYVFRIRCYASVTHVLILGEPTQEHTWFPGYAWTVLCCAQCQSHVGWRFRADESQFHTLIVDQIDEG